MADAILTVKHLNKSYGHQPVLRDVSFECTQGRIVGLVGANGAGKTTIMKAILGLLSTDGEIQIAGESMRFDHHPILATVGSLIEYPSLYPYMSGWDNLRLFAGRARCPSAIGGGGVRTKHDRLYPSKSASLFIGDETKAWCRPGLFESAATSDFGRTDEWFGSTRY